MTKIITRILIYDVIEELKDHLSNLEEMKKSNSYATFIDEEDGDGLVRLVGGKKFPKYFCISEQNEHEGETWYFLFSYDDDERWSDIFDRLDEILIDSSWEIRSNRQSKYDVDVLLNGPESTYYMNEYNMRGYVTYDAIKKFVSCKECISDVLEENAWYKGSIHFICPHEDDM